MKMNIRFLESIVFILIIGFMASCAAPEKTTRPSGKAKEVKGFEKMREDFDPLSLNDDDIKIEEPEANYSTFEEDYVELEQTLTDTIGVGYRVQLIQTSDPEEAKDVQKDAILRFDYDVYRVFDPPFYKVRIGDFINWSDAEQVQKLAIQKGYREAWVIRTKVNLKNAYKGIDGL